VCIVPGRVAGWLGNYRFVARREDFCFGHSVQAGVERLHYLRPGQGRFWKGGRRVVPPPRAPLSMGPQMKTNDFQRLSFEIIETKSSQYEMSVFVLATTIAFKPTPQPQKA